MPSLIYLKRKEMSCSRKFRKCLFLRYKYFQIDKIISETIVTVSERNIDVINRNLQRLRLNYLPFSDPYIKEIQESVSHFHAKRNTFSDQPFPSVLPYKSPYIALDTFIPINRTPITLTKSLLLDSDVHAKHTVVRSGDNSSRHRFTRGGRGQRTTYAVNV